MSVGRRLSLAIALALAVLASQVAGHSAGAQTPGDSPVIAVIDMQRVMRESKAVQSIQQQIGQQRDAYQEELSKKEQELRQADEELSRQRTILSSDAFTKKRRQLEQQVGELQREIQNRKKLLDRNYSQAMQTVQQKLVEIVQNMATTRDIDMVVNKASVIIVRSELEITGTVIERLNNQLTAVDVPTLQN